MKTLEEFKKDRELAEKGALEMFKDWPRPENVERFDDIFYAGTNDPLQSLDVFRATDAEGPLPIIINVHGGGWVSHYKTNYQFYAMHLASKRFGVINFSYRLAPETRYPGQMEDVNAAVKWTLAHAEEYGLDPNRIFMVGDSAGAHLLATYLCILTNPEYAKTYAFDVPHFKPLAVGLNCGAFEVDKMTGPMHEDIMTALLGDVTEERLRWIVPLYYMNDEFPPTFLLTGNEDFARTNVPAMIEALMANNVSFELRYFAGAGKHINHDFHADLKLPEAYQANEEEVAFFRSFL